MKEIRFNRLKDLLSDPNIRLSALDKQMLNDLIKVKILDSETAGQHIYDNEKRARQRLDRLADAGLLQKVKIKHPQRGQTHAYQIASDKLAKRLGTTRLSNGRNNSAFHNLITSKIYYAEGRPESFRLESDYDRDFKLEFRRVAINTGAEGILPDACYTNKNGELVLVEADSGQYNRRQIDQKINSWRDMGFKSVAWGKPTQQYSKPRGEGVTVHNF